MPAAAKPDDELLRLASLMACRVLDTPPDPRFDRLVDLAAEHFSMPMALVTLVDEDRQWFKARHGVEQSETPREVAFCAHAILKPDEVLVVEDALVDLRFSDNPSVTGEPRLRFYAGAPILAEDGQPMGTLCVLDREPRTLDARGRGFLAKLAASASAMLELHRKNALLRQEAALDPLTGLANRRSFDAALALACDAAQAGVPFGLLCMDLDRFKQVNDTLGHDAGDRLLREVARRLAGTVRETDIVARLGGDEFAVIINGPTDLEGARAAARHILVAFAPDMEIAGARVPIRASLGVATAPGNGTNPASLARAADEALYRAKRDGGQMLKLAAHATPAAAASEALQDALRADLAEDRLALHWQPCFAADGRVARCEALLRWPRAGQDGAEDLVAPGVFLPVAAKAGLMGRVDAWVLRHACAEAAGWAAPVPLSVNISGEWFRQGDLVGLVEDALARSGLAPERLILELTERTLIEHPDAARAGLAALRRLGVRAALDDFGTAASSLGTLYHFHVDEVKLDPRFIAGLGHDRRAEAICRAVLALGREIGMQVCAEGVETPEQLRFLREAGCDLFQGYLLGRPQAEATLGAWQVG